ncbi:hypothetical protein C8Q77DRAFT_271930 [Trametes polyzona]|nr:hypothetical protein C8Q77DRAFT_271930 [Trametes polyzona]
MCAGRGVWHVVGLGEIRTGSSGCAAAGFVSVVRIASPRLPSHPQLLPFHTGRRAPSPAVSLTWLPSCLHAAQSLLRDHARCVNTYQHPPGPLDRLTGSRSSLLFRQASEDLRSVRTLRFRLCSSYTCPARDPRFVQARKYPTSADPIAWYRPTVRFPHAVRHRSMAFATMPDSSLPRAKLRLPRDAPTEIRFSLSLMERAPRPRGGIAWGTVVGRVRRFPDGVRLYEARVRGRGDA